MSLSVGLAFIAGLASFLTPCVFSLVPAYISYLSGRSISQSGSDQAVQNISTLAHGFAFIFGFSVVFIFLGIAASVVGSLLYDLRFVLTKLGGIIVVLFGLHMSEILQIPILDYELRPQNKISQNRSLLSSIMLGVFFSAGWSPCVGPVLGAILTLAVNGGSVFKGIILLTAYSAGLAVPFLFAAIGIGWVTKILNKYSKFLHFLKKGMGGILVIIGILLFFNIFEQIARFGPFVDFGI